MTQNNFYNYFRSCKYTMHTTFQIIFFTSMIFFSSLQADSILMNNIEERKFTTSGVSYILKAKNKNINLKLLKKMNLINRKHIMSNSIYYTNGTLYKKDIKVDFEKGFFFEGVFYMENCYCKYKDGYIKSEMAEVYNTNIKFKNLILKKKNKIFHKFKYTFETD